MKVERVNDYYYYTVKLNSILTKVKCQCKPSLNSIKIQFNLQLETNYITEVELI